MAERQRSNAAMRSARPLRDFGLSSSVSTMSRLFRLYLGLLLGIGLALAAGRFLGSQLYGINQYDPMIIAVAMLVLGISALVAALIPAFRASSISPLQALRAE